MYSAAMTQKSYIKLNLALHTCTYIHVAKTFLCVHVGNVQVTVCACVPVCMLERGGDVVENGGLLRAGGRVWSKEYISQNEFTLSPMDGHLLMHNRHFHGYSSVQECNDYANDICV